MIIQKIKQFNSKFILIISLTIFYSCTDNTINSKINIIEADSSYTYCDKALVRLNNSVYLIKNRSTYNRQGDIIKYEIYKTEGKISYTKKALLEDKLFIEYENINILNRWELINSCQISNGVDTLDYEQIRFNNNNAIITKYKDERIIFTFY